MARYYLEFEPVAQDMTGCQVCGKVREVRLWMPTDDFKLDGLEALAIEICQNCEDKVFRKLP